MLDATGTRQSLAEIGTELSFTLLEPASYSISASFDGFFTPHEPSDSNALMVVGLDRFDPFGRLELAGDRNFAGGNISACARRTGFDWDLGTRQLQIQFFQHTKRRRCRNRQRAV